MRILLTISDRDLLKALETLLAADGHTVTTAFDGVQALAKVDGARFELAVVDSGVSRVEVEKLAADIADSGIPVIVLTDKTVSRELAEKAMPVSAFLPYPFEPGELRALVSAVADKAARGETFAAGELTADEGRFLLRRAAGPDGETICVTAAELDILKAAASGAELPRGIGGAYEYIGALNTKFGRLGAAQRIAYLPGKGYRLVTDND